MNLLKEERGAFEDFMDGKVFKNKATKTMQNYWV